MANVKSAKKRILTNAKARLRNRMVRSALRKAIKNARTAIDQGNAEQAKTFLPAALSLIGRTASKGVIHRRTAARTESRLLQAYNKAFAKS